MGNPYNAPFSESQADQQLLVEQGGGIDFVKGQPVFNFPSWEHYQSYIQVKQQRFQEVDCLAGQTTD